ncbi:MAG: nucleotidyltransferase family protein [Flammeovirgaceae bacterium]
MTAAKNVAILIIAAGASSRMGSPKQLLTWRNTTLLGHAIQQAVQANAQEVFVVLGANYERIYPTISSQNISILKHKQWAKGMGTSIAFGISQFMHRDFEGALIMLADQPQVTTNYLNQLIEQFESGQQQLIATSYTNAKIGVPALFDASYFAQLMALEGDKGAKKVIQQHAEFITLVEPEEELVDIDTMEEYEQLVRRMQHKGSN